MRDRPAIDDEGLIACIRVSYRIDLASVRFLPIGHDPNAAVFEGGTADGTSFFIKLRAGEMNNLALRVPHLLAESGIPNILAPVPTTDGSLHCSLDHWSVILYPFVRGENAKVVGLTDEQWRAFGATLKAIHTGGFAERLRGDVPAESFALLSASLVREVTAQLQGAAFSSPAATDLAAFWNDQVRFIEEIVTRAESLGKQLQTHTFEHVLCHADIHAANILVGDDGRIYLVDWDGPLLAPPERDLLFIVGANIARRVTPREEALFFEGYGPFDVNWRALAYYRYERAIEDIGVFGQTVFFDPRLSEEARTQEAALLKGMFAPDEIIASALAAERKSSTYF